MKCENNVSGYLIRRLIDYGVGHVFGVPGDYILDFYRQLEESPLQLINTSDEQGAGFAADAYARLNGLGVVCVTYCVGGLKIANTTAQAFAEKSPVVVISGAPGLNERRRNPLLHHKIRDFDTQLRIFRQLTVAATDLSETDNGCQEIDRVLAAAVRYNRPVYIELPRDLNASACGPLQTSLPDPPESDGEALGEALDEARRMLGEARQPVAIAGIELQRFGLEKQFLELVEGSGIPFAATALSKGGLSEDHPLYLGVYEGAVGDDSIRRYVEESDCLLLLGAFMTDINLGIYTADLNRARSISATSEGSAIAYHQYPEVFLADLLHGLLTADLPRRPPASLPGRPASASFIPGDDPVSIKRLFQCLDSFIDSQTTVLADPGEAMFSAADLTICHPAAFLCPAYYTSMGFAVPGAIGAQLARPDLRPLVVTGDGAFQMTGMELATAARFGLTPIVIVLNNRGYGTERPMTDGAFNDIPGWRYSRLPEVFGSGRGYEIRTEKELDRALQEARHNDRELALIEVHLDQDDHSPAFERLTAALGKRVRQSNNTER